MMLAMSGKDKTEHPKAVAVKELQIHEKDEKMVLRHYFYYLFPKFESCAKYHARMLQCEGYMS